MIVHAELGETLEFFINTTEEKGLNHKSFKEFLVRQLSVAPVYMLMSIQKAIVAVDKVYESEYGFPEIGKTCTGAARHVIMNHNLYSMQFSVIHIYNLED